VQVTINSVSAVLNGVPVGVWAGSAVTVNGYNGYDFDLVRSAPYDPFIPYAVHIEADDLASNHNTLDWAFQTGAGLEPVFLNVTPVAGSENVSPTIAIAFTVVCVTHDLDPDAIQCVVDGVPVYEHETARIGYAVQRTVVVDGYAYIVTSTRPRIWGGLVSVFLAAESLSGAYAEQTFGFQTAVSPACFTGPLNTFEESLIQPFVASVPVLEQMRVELLQSLADTDPVVAARAMFLHGHRHDLAIILRDMAPTPTSVERDALLCKRRALLAVAQALPDQRLWLAQSLVELAALGVPREHRQLIQRYFDVVDEVQTVMLMCFVVLLAKAME
jgi:hypothetical protein